jgi:hypothetical protein
MFSIGERKRLKIRCARLVAPANPPAPALKYFVAQQVLQVELRTPCSREEKKP